MEELENFKEQISSKRHQEILKALEKAVDIKPLQVILEKNTTILNSIIEKLSQEKSLDITVDNNQGEVIKELKTLSKSFKQSLEELKFPSVEVLIPPPINKEEWEFDIKRNKEGYIEKVIAKEK